MKGPPTRPRIEEVAAHARVSPATVSRYFTKRNLVSDDTALRIKKAVDELGYVPNLLAGGLASNRSRLVALLVPSLAPFETIIEAIAARLTESGYTPMLGVSGLREQALPAVIDAALERRVDAVILTGIVIDLEMRFKLEGAGVTVVETWGLPPEPIDCAVGFSNAAIGRATAAFLHKRGYVRPLIVTARWSRSGERRDGFSQEWQKLCDRPFREVEVTTPSRFGQARPVFRSVQALGERPDVLVCGSDSLAQGLIVEAVHAGLSVPEDVAIMGFGDLAIAGVMRPPITTIAVHGDRIGIETATILNERYEDHLAPAKVVDVGFQIIQRESA